MASNKQVLKDWDKLNNFIKNYNGTWEELKNKLDLSTNCDEDNIDIYYGCFEGTIHNKNGQYILDYSVDVMNEDLYDDWDNDVDIRLLRESEEVKGEMK